MTQLDSPATTESPTAEPIPGDVAPSPHARPPRKTVATAIEAAEEFAAALVSGNLTALTLSFAPAGLMQARELAAQNGAETPGFTSATIHASEEIGGQPAAWSITFAVVTEAGVESYFETRWQSFPEVGWRIVSLSTGA